MDMLKSGFMSGLFVISLLLLVFPSVSLAYHTASTSKIVYVINDTMVITGTTSSSNVNLTATIYSSGSSMAALTNTSNGTAFYFYKTLNFPAGSYYVSVSDSSSSVYVNFSIVSEKVYTEASLIASTDIKNISTNTLITTDTQLGGNFAELLNLSLSRVLHYGNATIDSKTYHFVLVDQNYNHTYDTMYVDDDKLFLLYNDTEDSGNNSDIEKVLKKGDAFKTYNINELEFYTGNKTILAVPATSSAYQSGYVYFIVSAKNSNGVLLPGQNLTIRLLDSTGSVLSSLTGVATNSFGYYVTNFSVPLTSGAYTIDLNSGMGTEVFSVESFKLYGKITDTSDSPTYSFAPNPAVRIQAIAKSGGNAINLTTAHAYVYYPNGTTRTISLSESSLGMYRYDIDLSGAPSGAYGVKIVGSYGGNSQEFRMGFAIESIKLEAMAINPSFMDQASEGTGAMVDAFAPGSNITILAALSNITAGGLFSEGQPGEESGIIDIDESSTPEDECSSRVSILELKDEKGFSYSIVTDFNYTVENLSTAMAGFSMPEGEGPPEAMLRQCMIVITGLSKKGTYRLSAQVNYNGEKKVAGSSFGIQRVIVTGNTVDFKGDNFGFFAPNATVRIKLRITDMLTHSELPAVNITNAKIMGMQKEYPSYRDINVQNLSESVVNGTIQFTSPNEEGFFSMKFRFKANVAGSLEEGTGTAFFQLKKYMIWGNIPCQREPCYVASEKNVTLDVTVVDIDKGSMMDLGMSSGLTCSNCQGLIVNVSMLRNEQLMKEITAYTVITGAITNSSNPTVNITIVPNSANSLPTGWYGVDIILTDPTNTNNTYFGFAWFEIRNFYVEMIPITAAENLTAMWQEPTYAANQPILFGIIPRNPATPDIILTPSAQPVVESVKWMNTWPPPDVSFNSTITKTNVTIVNCEGNDCPPPSVSEMWVINLTGLSKSGNHQANVRVNVSGLGSDVGSFWFDLSSFKVSAQYRGMESWPPVFSNDENLTVTFIGCEFGEGCTPRNLSNAKCNIFDKKRGEPIRLNYSTSCVNNTCITRVNLSQLSLNGKYGVDFTINDTAGNVKKTGMEFVTQSVIVSVPRIEESWIWYSDTTKRELNLDNDRDRCDNQKNLMSSNCQERNDSICLFGSELNITVSSSYNYSQGGGNVLCVGLSGQWDDRGPGGCGNDTGTTIYAVSNTTHIWINTTIDLSSTTPRTVGDTFTMAGKTWNITSVSDNNFNVKHANGLICGEAWQCSNEGCQQSNYTLRPLSNYSEFYHGYVNLVGDNNVGNNLGPEFDSERYVYVYHNKTHIWVSTGTDLTSVTPKAKNEIVSFNGTWKVTLLNKQLVELEGQDVLANTGAYIPNSSLSRSGVFKLGKIEENRLGSWNKNSGQRNGMDMNGDGAVNGSAYFMITDNSTSGIYDMFMFSKNNTFTNLIPISANRTVRTFGLNDTLTLLNIDPRASNIRFYSNQTGDWSEIGEYRVGNNITIPIMVSSPSGSSITRNVSISWIKRKYGGTDTFTNITPVTKEINYLGELSINVSSFGPGEFIFQISAGDILEEWKWPRATTRVFLVDSETCDGGYISNFKPLPLTRYDWENYGDVKEIYSANWSSHDLYYSAVFSFDAWQERIVNETTQPVNYTACTFVKPPGAGSGGNFTNVTVRSNELGNPQYYFYLTDANLSKVWAKTGNCNFTNSIMYSVNDDINVERDGKIYRMRVLNASISAENSVIIGLANFNENAIQPLRTDQNGVDNNPSNKWRIMTLNLSGTNYNVVLSNATIEYPLCSVWNVQECAKKAWFSTTGNFASAVGAGIGQNFTTDLYLAKIGPGPWDGIIIANFSQVPQKPAVDVRSRDNTTSYFNALSEASLGIDLDLDSALTKAFYLVAFDGKDDGVQSLTEIVSDDDPNITEDWWSQNINGQNYYKDFYSNETGIREQRNNLPKGISNGNIRFGEMNNSLPWEQNPEWEILVYNNTDMLVRKSKWMINANSNVTIMIKAYNFNQTPLQGANVTLLSVMKMSFGFQILNSSYYALSNVQNVTDQYGYGILKLAPVGSWSQGEYMVTAEVQYGSTTETINRWFRINS